MLSIVLNGAQLNAKTKGYLLSRNQYYQSNAGIASSDTVNQRKEIAEVDKVIGAAISYALPIWKGAALGVIYEIGSAKDNPIQETFDRGGGKYNQIVGSLSSDIDTKTATQKTTVNVQGKLKKMHYALGVDWLERNYTQHDVISDSIIYFKYSYLMPRLLLSYTPNSSSMISFNYTTAIQQPNPSDMSPIKNNSDPLHVTEGNPLLKPSFNQGFTMAFHRFKECLINFALNVMLTNNNISTRTITDSIGRQISQPVNINGGKVAALYFSIGKRLFGFEMELHNSESLNKNMNYLNSDLNSNNIYAIGSGIKIVKYMENKYSFQLYSNFSYFAQTSSLNSNFSIHYWTQYYTSDVRLLFVRKFDIGTGVIYNWQGKSSSFVNNASVFLWNMHLGRSLFHDNLDVKVQVNNIMNQNSGISRNNVGNISSQSTTNVIGRYWMLSMTYHFERKSTRKS